jgi:hypothetical protein
MSTAVDPPRRVRRKIPIRPKGEVKEKEVVRAIKGVLRTAPVSEPSAAGEEWTAKMSGHADAETGVTVKYPKHWDRKVRPFEDFLSEVLHSTVTDRHQSWRKAGVERLTQTRELVGQVIAKLKG